MSGSNNIFCLPFEQGIKIIAIGDAVINTAYLIWEVTVAVGEVDGSSDIAQRRLLSINGQAAFIIEMFLIGFWSLAYICVAIWIMTPVKNKNYKGCKCWVYVSIAVCVGSFIWEILYFLGADFTKAWDIGITAFYVVYWIFKIYEICVVWAFAEKGLAKGKGVRQAAAEGEAPVDGHAPLYGQGQGQTVPGQVQQQVMMPRNAGMPMGVGGMPMGMGVGGIPMGMGVGMPMGGYVGYGGYPAYGGYPYGGGISYAVPDFGYGYGLGFDEDLYF